MSAFWCFFKPTLKLSITIICFPEEICLLFHISAFIKQISELKICYWLETDDFFSETGKNAERNYQKHAAICISLYYFTTGNHYSNFIKTGNIPIKKISVENQHQCNTQFFLMKIHQLINR